MVYGISKKAANRMKHEVDKNRKMTVSQFFADKYKRKLDFGNLPCIIIDNLNFNLTNFVPIEVCEILPGLF